MDLDNMILIYHYKCKRGGGFMRGMEGVRLILVEPQLSQQQVCAPAKASGACVLRLYLECFGQHC